MKSVKEKNSFYQKKRNIKSNKNLRINYNKPLEQSKQNNYNKNSILRKKIYFQSQSGVLNTQNKNDINIFKSLQNNETENNINDIIPIYDNMTYDNQYSFEKPKIKIKLHSTTHNNININSISSEKNNNSIKYKIHRIKPKNLKCSERILHKTAKKNINNYRVNYTAVHSIANLFDSSELNTDKTKNQKYSKINQKYSKIQEQNLINLNNNIENLIKEQSLSNYISTRNNNKNILENKINNFKKIINNEMNQKDNNFNINNNNINELSHWKKLIYRKKIQRKNNNYSETFSKIKYLNLDKESEIKDINTFDKSEEINNISSNILNYNKTYKLIYDFEQTPQKNELLSNPFNELKNTNYYKKNPSVILSSFTLTEPKKTILENNHKDNEYNEYIKAENNILSLLNSDKKRDKHLKKEYNNTLENNKSDITGKKILDYNSSYNTRGLLINSNLNNLTNIYNYNDNISKTINNNYTIGTSYSISDYNTINSLNNSEKNSNYLKNNISIRWKPNKNMKNTYFVPDYNTKNNILKQQSELLNKNDKFKKIKKLKNLITSIECKNKNININNINKKNEIDNKNIILSEFSNNGKLNIKFKKMNNSIEKIIRENSNPKINKVTKITKLPYENLTYVKKNQGIKISKIKK